MQLILLYVISHVYAVATAVFLGPSKVTVPEANGSVTLCIEVTGGVSEEYPVSVMVSTSTFLLAATCTYT